MNWNQRGEVIGQWAETLGLSPSTIHRHIKRFEGKQRRYTREPNQHYVDITREVIAYKNAIADANNGREPSTRRALKELQKAGKITPPIPSISTVNNLRNQILPKRVSSTKPHVILEADYPNQYHFMDLSVSKWLVPIPGSLDTVKVVSPHARHKESHDLKVWTLGAADRYSSLFAIEYRVMRGENASDVLHFMRKLYSQDSPFPFAGIPENLVCDNGSFGKSKIGKAGARQLGIKMHLNAPYQSRANGAIETRWQHMWRDFEGPQFAPRVGTVMTLEEVNQLLESWLIEWANMPHPQHPMLSRIQRWQKIGVVGGEFRTLDKRARFGAVHEKRTVDGACTISFNRIRYACPSHLRGQRVIVWIGWEGDPFAVVDPDSGEAYEITEYEPVKLGTYRSVAQTDNERDISERMKEPLPVSSVVGSELDGSKQRAKIQSKNERIEILRYRNIEEAMAYISGEIDRSFGMPLPEKFKPAVLKAIGKDLSKSHVQTVANKLVANIRRNLS